MNLPKRKLEKPHMSSNAGKKFRFLRISIQLCIVLLVIGLSACPRLIDESLVIAVEDTLAPVVKIIQPLPNESYSSMVEVQGKITDDSITVGDKSGIIKSVAFDVANDDFRRGKINIATDGAYSQDPTGGDILIEWFRIQALLYSLSTPSRPIFSQALSS
jgi:hypothetical protein